MRKFKYFQLGGKVLDDLYAGGLTIVNPEGIEIPGWWARFFNTEKNQIFNRLYSEGFNYPNSEGQLEFVLKEEGPTKEDREALRKYLKDLEISRLKRMKYGNGSTLLYSAPGAAVRNYFDNGSRIVTITEPEYNVTLNNKKLYRAYEAFIKSLNQDMLRRISSDGMNITEDDLSNFFGDSEFNEAYLNGLVSQGQLTPLQVKKIVGFLPKGDPTLQALLNPTLPTEEGWAEKYEKLGFNRGLTKEGNENYNNQLYNRVLGYRNANNLSLTDEISTALPEDAQFYNDYYVYSDNGKKYYVGPNTAYDEDGKEVHKKVTFNKKGGFMKYFQTGGSLTEQQAQQEMSNEQSKYLIAAFNTAALSDFENLSKVFGISTREKLNNFIKLVEKYSKIDVPKGNQIAEALKKAAIGALTGIRQGLGMGLKAEKGAKLEYIQRLRGKCPEGYEAEMFKVGGKVGCKCKKKAEEGVKLADGGESPIVQQFKKGRKCKK